MNAFVQLKPNGTQITVLCVELDVWMLLHFCAPAFCALVGPAVDAEWHIPWLRVHETPREAQRQQDQLRQFKQYRVGGLLYGGHHCPCLAPCGTHHRFFGILPKVVFVWNHPKRILDSNGAIVHLW